MDEFQKRFSAAKAHRREYMEMSGREVYKFCFNGREREWDNTARRDDEPEEIFSDVFSTVAEEFGGDLFTTMTPENTPWVEYEAGNAVEEQQVDDAQDQIGIFENAIAKAIRASNYYQEGHAAFQDAAVGLVGMWVDRPALASPAYCRAVPASKTYVRLGPFGINDRFYEERYFYHDLPAVLPGASFDKELTKKIKESRSATAVVVWGFWRDYSDAANPIWIQGVRVDKKPVGLDQKLGEEGSCPFIVGPFNPVPGSAWGRGPGVRMLPTLRVLDELTRMNLEGLDRNLDPSYLYAHDGMLDLSDGIESGMGYPKMPGTENAVEQIGMVGSLDYGFFSEERLYEVVRDGFYREIEQRGKTPPSATQYMGQEQKQLRRMARPAGPLWGQFGVGILKRFEYLEREPGGSLEGLRLPLLQSGAVIARPISPLERAQAREDVMVAQSIMEMAQSNMGPEQAALYIDGPDTFKNIKSALKDQIVTVRTPEQIQAVLEQVSPQNDKPS